MSSLELVWTEVDSSNVKAVSHHEPSNTLLVQFNNGGLYSYDGVDHELYADLVHAPSVGKYLNQVIKGMHPYERWLGVAELEMHLHTL